MMTNTIFSAAQTSLVLDIGGTAIKSAVFQNDELFDLSECPTEAKLGGPHVMDTAIRILRRYQKDHAFSSIGISTAGQVDPDAGRIVYANQNIPSYTGMEIKKMLESEFCVPVAVENDVNAAAIGESRFGAGRGERDFACLTYGTGIGGALFLNGALYRGSSFSAGEFGAIVTHPEDRRPNADPFDGCYERYASVTALMKRALALDPALTNGRILFSRFDDPAVRRLIDNWITEIVWGLVTITHMTNPSCLILGGGIMEQSYVTEEIARRLFENLIPSFRHVRVKKAQLGNRAGLFGAAVRIADSLLTA